MRSLGNHDSGFQSPPAEAGGDDATVGDEANGDDTEAGSPGDASSGTDDSGDAAVGDGGGAEIDAGDAGTSAEGGAGTPDAGDAGIILDSGGVDSSTPIEAGAADAGSVGTVPCGTATVCTASSQVCCYGAAANPTCTAKNACTGTAIDCRATSNCQDGEILLPGCPRRDGVSHVHAQRELHRRPTLRGRRLCGERNVHSRVLRTDGHGLRRWRPAGIRRRPPRLRWGLSRIRRRLPVPLTAHRLGRRRERAPLNRDDGCRGCAAETGTC